MGSYQAIPEYNFPNACSISLARLLVTGYSPGFTWLSTFSGSEAGKVRKGKSLAMGKDYSKLKRPRHSMPGYAKIYERKCFDG